MTDKQKKNNKMSDRQKKELEDMKRRSLTGRKLLELKKIGKKRSLLNVDQYKKGQEKVLIERLIKGKQLSDYSKDYLLEKARMQGLFVNATMSKNITLQKLKNPKPTDLSERRLRKIAGERGIALKVKMTKDEIITRIENPTKYYTIGGLKKIAEENNIKVSRNIRRSDLIKILEDRNIIASTPITEEESNLGVMLSNVSMRLIKAVKQKARNAREALINFKNYFNNFKKDFITSRRLKKLTKTLEAREREAKEEHDRIFVFRKELSAFNNFTDQYVMNGSDIYDGRSFLREAKNSIINVLDSNRGIKARLYFNCVMVREKDGEELRANFYFHSKLKIILASTDVEEVL